MSTGMKPFFNATPAEKTAGVIVKSTFVLYFRWQVTGNFHSCSNLTHRRFFPCFFHGFSPSIFGFIASAG